jgi:AcrR family transcriptional regulator
MAAEDPAPDASDPLAGLPLRERKRLRAMRRIQTVALDLFDARGFDQVTIEDIARRCEVSASSVYRYFGTKEQLVIWDEYDPAAIEAIVAELDSYSPYEAVRRVIGSFVQVAFEQDEDRIRRRLHLAYSTPSIEAASALQGYEMARLIAGILAAKLGRDPDDLDVQVFAHAYVGGVLGGMRHWYASGFSTPLPEILDRPLAALEGRIDLG